MAYSFPGLSHQRFKSFVYESPRFTKEEKSVIANSNLADGSLDYSQKDLEMLSTELRGKFLNLHALQQGLLQKNPSKIEKPELPIGQLAICAVTLGLLCAVGCSPSFSDIGGVEAIDVHRITEDPNDSRSSGLAWTGNEYGIVWSDNRDFITRDPDDWDAVIKGSIYFAKLDRDGQKVGKDMQLVHDPTQSLKAPRISWAGGTFGFVWNGGITHGNYFGKLNQENNRITSFQISTNQISGDNSLTYYNPSLLLWNGNEYNVAWQESLHDNSGQINLARINGNGEKVRDNLWILTVSQATTIPSIAWNGLGFGVAFENNPQGNPGIYFARIHLDASKTGLEIKIVDSPSASEPFLVWNGKKREYGVSWVNEQDGNGEVYFARLKETGQKIGSNVRITENPLPSYNPSLVWTGEEYGLSWVDGKNGDAQVRFVRLNSVGEKIGADVKVSNGVASSDPSLVWNGKGYAISWEDRRDGNWDIYFARVIGQFNP